ncbi:hypothetical protein ACEYYA_06090 [Paracoccus sp. p3-h83]|uniref:hypothetical protein n=1 Tax=Paracoccus sp. p3-h83 TaxID=3342805 RepID=UPI0035B96AD2
MSVVARMARMWIAPRRVAAEVMGLRLSEPAALATLLSACGLFFVAQWPGHARAAHLDPLVPLDARIGGALLATMFMLPLLAYAMAALSHLALWLAGRRGVDGLRLRVALFWAMLAVAPAMLLAGLVQGYIGPGPGLTLTRAVAGIGFGIFWAAGIAAALKGA